MQDRAERWSKTGIVILRECGLQDIPAEVWGTANCQSLDLKSNSIQSLPSELSSLRSLTRLNLDNNLLSSESQHLSALAVLTQLHVLSLRHNRQALVHSLPNRTRHVGSLNCAPCSGCYLCLLPLLSALSPEHSRLSSTEAAMHMLIWMLICVTFHLHG